MERRDSSLLQDAYTAFIAEWLFPLHETLKRHTTAVIRKDLEQSQWWSSDRLEQYQAQRLRKLLSECQKYVPYYRQLFGKIGLDTSQIHNTSDLAKLPFLTKENIRQNFEALKSENRQRLALFNTGGSSGEPLIFCIDNERISHDIAAKWRATRWWGVDIGDSEVVIWGSPIELGAQDWFRGLRDKVLRTHLLPAFEMSEVKLEAFVSRIRKIRPKMLFGYPSALSHIAQYAERQTLSMDDLGIRVAFVTAERVYDHQRQRIERIFGCPVANGYGARDAGFIAHECPAGGLHITAEDILLEIVGTDGRVLGAGEPGEIVITHLATRGFPFVRYRTGDIGTLDEALCPCGRGLPLLKEVQGRTTDFLVAADGTVVHGLALIYVLREISGIEAFKIIQEDINAIKVLIVRGTQGLSGKAEQVIVEGFRERLGPQTTVRIEFVDTIPHERSGKHRYVVSKVPIGGGEAGLGEREA